MLFTRIRAYGSQSGEFRYEGPDGNKACSSFTCQHCNRVIPVPFGSDPSDIGGLCKSCMGLICPQCVGRGGCDPIEAKIDRMENLRRFLQDVG